MIALPTGILPIGIKDQYKTMVALPLVLLVLPMGLTYVGYGVGVKAVVVKGVLGVDVDDNEPELVPVTESVYDVEGDNPVLIVVFSVATALECSKVAVATSVEDW